MILAPEQLAGRNEQHPKTTTRTPLLVQVDLARLFDLNDTGWGPGALEASLADGELEAEGTELLAYYLPLHFHGLGWAIVLKDDGVRYLADRFQKRPATGLDNEQAVRAAAVFLYYHEVFQGGVGCCGEGRDAPPAAAGLW